MLDKLLAWDRAAARGLVWVGGAGLIFAAFMVTFDVIIRDVLGRTLGGADEISGYIFAIATAFAFPYALLHRANVRIDALYVLFPSRVRAVLNLVSMAVLAVFVFPLTWWVFAMVQDSIAFSTRSITPMRMMVAIPQSLWLAGLLMFCFSILLILVVSVVRLARGDLAGVQRVAGVLTLISEDDGEGPTAGQVG
jgi:TRAP-type C4-dicarboxylate transport system permease small subunit